MTKFNISGSFIGKSVQLILACLLAIPWLLAPQGTDAREAIAREEIALAANGTQAIMNTKRMVLPAAGGPDIEVWYTDQSDKIEFGAYGTPQPQINILGNVSDPDGVRELTYSLNGASQKDVNFGASPAVVLNAASVGADQGGMSDNFEEMPVWAAAESDNARLELPGDFNIEIPTAQLSSNNTVLLRAEDDNGNTSSKTISVQYTSGVVPSLPFIVDWTDVTGITEKTQVVDGRWTWNQQAGTIRSEVGYDRLVALGDLSWSEYEVEVPITINDLPSSNSGGIGFAVRWNGHLSENGDDPGKVWWNLGAYAYYRKRSPSNGGPHLMIRTDKSDDDPSSTAIDYDVDYIQEGKTYTFKIRVEDDTNIAAADVNGSPAYFSFKVWETGQTEPDGWQLEIADGGVYDPSSGSVVLAAHNADVSFGKVTVRPLNPIENYDVTVATKGEGKVFLDSPQGSEFISDTFASGTVLTLVPEPETDWAFAKWSGDVPAGKETDRPLSITVDGETSLVAEFNQTICRLTVTTDPQASGNVTKLPTQDAFFCIDNDEVTLTANSTPGWAFAGWSGDVADGQENQNPLVITMDSTKALLATFVEDLSDQFTLNATVTAGEGIVNKNPDQTQYESGTSVDITATADAGWGFAGWSGNVPIGQENNNPLTIIVDSAKSVGAKFETLYTLTTAVDGQGAILRSPEKDEFFSGETVTLLASPINGWVFSGWSGDVSTGEKNQEIVVTMNRSKSITADFSRLLFIPIVAGN